MDKKRLRGRPRTVGGGDRNPIDLHVGERLRQRRRLLGISRVSLGRTLALTSQQIQKFERGTNRISASRLFDFARALEVPIGFFFDDMPEGLTGPAEPGRIATADPLTRHETVELVRAFHTIPNRQLRRSICEVARALASNRRFGASVRNMPPPASGTEEDNGAERAS